MWISLQCSLRGKRPQRGRMLSVFGEVWEWAYINPLSPNSDQQQFSPYNIHMLANEMVMRVNTMITKEKMLWSVIKLSQLILLSRGQENDVWGKTAEIPYWWHVAKQTYRVYSVGSASDSKKRASLVARLIKSTKNIRVQLHIISKEFLCL